MNIIAQRGLEDQDRQRLFALAKLSSEEFQALTHLSLLGVRLSASMEKRNVDEHAEARANPYAHHVLKKRGIVSGKGGNEEAEFENSRYVPVVKYMLLVYILVFLATCGILIPFFRTNQRTPLNL